jgi:hypothetical protein
MQARILLGAGLLAFLVFAAQAQSPPRKVCRDFLALSDNDKLIYAEALYEGYHAALLRASFFSNASGKESPTSLRSFSKFAQLKPVSFSEVESRFEDSCSRDPSGQMRIPEAFLSVAQELETRGKQP